jgi:general secretion pathway protein A
LYEAWYGLTEKPFNLTPDPKFLYLSQRHAEAFAHLEFGRRERGGFILITGEVGTGKTTLARYFLSRLPETTATAVVLYPALTAAELLKSVLDDVHVPTSGSSLKELVDALHRFLLEARRQGRDVVLLIDEAQDLAPDVLEQIRLLSNLETDTEKLIQIVLMGQSELRDLLARRELRQLAQRVTARYHLDPLSRTEAEEYIRHRLTVAGGAGKVAFAPAALREVHRWSSGIPRLINLICDRALLAGYVKGERTIDAAMVRQAAAEITIQGTKHLSPRRLALFATSLVLAAAFVAALALPRTLRAPNEAPEAPAATSPASVNRGSASGASAGLMGPLPSPAAPAPGVDAARLESLLLATPRAASLEAALRRITGLWGDPQLERTSLRTHFDQVRRLDLPVILEVFHPGRRDTCFLALLALDKDSAEVAVGGEPPLRVTLPDLDRFWTREALFLWRDPAGLQRDPARAEQWARDALASLGYGGDPRTAVSRFQRDAQLLPDGVVGSRTLMTLASQGPEARPRLSAPRRPS